MISCAQNDAATFSLWAYDESPRVHLQATSETKTVKPFVCHEIPTVNNCEKTFDKSIKTLAKTE